MSKHKESPILDKDGNVIGCIRDYRQETLEEFLKRMQIVANETEQPGSKSGGDGR